MATVTETTFVQYSFNSIEETYLYTNPAVLY